MNKDQLVCVKDLELKTERFCSEDVSIVSPFSCCVAHKTILSKEIAISQLHAMRPW
jgi:hypothetical protein